ncbi:TniQ family protein [Pseudomonas coronafaciens]|uniref:TniQ family protein n=1 Tax=Pseudomonas coronafaciens TaxID=53409 RepID=UPI0006D6077C|nr:TniQ family protein [Pseudomonas coronafaciens]KPZ27209.1 Uncharacterized protein ALO38_03685 [Pseudomonas coronafaciens pv. zizaniae]
MFAHLPVPLWDETLSSWIHRASRGQGDYGQLLRLSVSACDANNGRPFSGGDFYTDEMPMFMADFDFESSQMADLARDLSKVSTDSYRRYFASKEGGIVPWDHRRVYCPACLEDDIQQVGYPSWKKSWCYGTSAYCVTHGELLKMLPMRDLGYDRAWEAFKYHTKYSEPPSGSRGWFSAHDSAYRHLLAKRVQVWLQSLSRRGQTILPGTDTSVFGPSLAASVHATYSILLRQRTRYSTGGFAKTLVRRQRPESSALDKPLPVRLKLGVYESTPYERMCALLVVGIIFRVIKGSETARLDGLARAAGSKWPTNVRRIGQQAIDFKNLEEYVVVRKLFQGVERAVMEHIADFIDGMETNTLSMRDLRTVSTATGRSGKAMWEGWLRMPESMM